MTLNLFPLPEGKEGRLLWNPQWELTFQMFYPWDRQPAATFQIAATYDIMYYQRKCNSVRLYFRNLNWIHLQKFLLTWLSFIACSPDLPSLNRLAKNDVRSPFFFKVANVSTSDSAMLHHRMCNQDHISLDQKLRGDNYHNRVVFCEWALQQIKTNPNVSVMNYFQMSLHSHHGDIN